ncbi:MAG: putative Transcriptional regulator, MarR family [Microbacteriaceae bacterium]|jgi:DNA-binding MarR family transcriptional regulator|nr:putative Transcriptional regulator, MarR family [Microbacteriaceae bacterium]HEV7957715.1 MarR family winged helix-turn-helix transcriptional regulator [Marisediminicola sp.]
MTDLDDVSVSRARRVSMSGSPRTQTVTYVEPPEIIAEPLNDILDANNFTPRLLALTSNALVARESRLLLREFNLGTNDWRVLSALALRPAATSTEISDFVAVNKAIVSKSVNTLISRELIVPADGPRGSRPLYLTRAGAEMHDAMKPISLAGQSIVLADLTADEIAQLNTLLRRILQKTPELYSDAGTTDSAADNISR